MSNTDSIKPIPGYEGYVASSNGTIWTRRHGNGKPGTAPLRQVNGSVLSNGYRRVWLSATRGERAMPCYVHRLVLLAFAGGCPRGMETRHLDGNRGNNSLENLCWGTPAENFSDKVRHGTSPRGNQLAPNVKLSPEEVRAIRQDAASGCSQRQLATRFGVSKQCVQHIVHRRNWAYLE